MKNLLTLFLNIITYIVALIAILYFIYYLFNSLNALFIYNKTLFISKLVYTLVFLILITGIWILLPKKIRIFLWAFLFSLQRIRLFKYGDPLTHAPANQLGIEYFIGNYRPRTRFIGMILISVSLSVFVYMLSRGLSPL